MNKSKSNGFVTIDTIISIIAIMIFSGLIFSLMYNNSLENIKNRREALATIYLTQTFENIGIADYDDVTEQNKTNFIPSDLVDNNYTMDITITQGEDENIIKKINAKISYELENKQYEYSMERIKIKE